ncbi:MAG: hypothetical protein BWX47_00136 [candidate division Hyd24-12 bacterium ADurb.Bin004]|nr:MAG: hypothetical protein BWX47_00136 [candidate division Hyd24-12 bacterium ADurb.Bin004]
MVLTRILAPCFSSRSNSLASLGLSSQGAMAGHSRDPGNLRTKPAFSGRSSKSSSIPVEGSTGPAPKAVLLQRRFILNLVEPSHQSSSSGGPSPLPASKDSKVMSSEMTARRASVRRSHIAAPAIAGRSSRRHLYPSESACSTHSFESGKVRLHASSRARMRLLL